MDFSERLKELRLEMGMTQTQLARVCNVSVQCISSLEMGTRSPSGKTLQVLSSHLGVTIDYLLGQTDEYIYGLSSVKDFPRDTLSPEEKFLVNSYRLLTPDDRVLLQAIVEVLYRRGPQGRD